MTARRIFTFCILFAMTLSTIFAQTDQSTEYKWVVGGNFSFSSEDIEESRSLDPEKQQSIGIRPYIGRQLNEHWIAGLQFGFDYSNYEYGYSILLFGSQPNNERTNFQSHLGLFARYTFNPKHNFQFYLQPFVVYNRGSINYLHEGETVGENSLQSISLGSRIGFAYRINKRWRLLLSSGAVRYRKAKEELEEVNSDDIFFLERDISSFQGDFRLSSLSFGLEFCF